ncbi:M13 family metallopeptidase [Sphingobium aromaticivastans]|uniref:M13 family metallopeptidase n=1 Tax=Sphingobium aromaticivastans TaxID=1778665 RepID=UPI003AFA8C8F
MVLNKRRVTMVALPFALSAAAPGPMQAQGVSNRPAYGAFGFDGEGMDPQARPGDDFYLYANGHWAVTTDVPADRSSYGAFAILEDLSRERTRAILEAAAKDSSTKIGAAYASFMASSAVEEKGMTPIQPWLMEIAAIKNRESYARVAAQASRAGVAGPFRIYISQDDKDPDRYILKLSQGGLGLPDRDYYLDPSEKMAAIRTAYVRYLEKMLTLAGQTHARGRAEALLGLETEIARTHWSRVDSRDVEKIYNKMTLVELIKTAPGFNFRAFFAANKIDATALIVAQPSVIVGEAVVIGNAQLDVLKDALLVRSLHALADVLPDRIGAEDFAFYGTVLTGAPTRPERWKRGFDFMKGALGEEVGKTYVAQYFPPQTKSAMDQLVKNVIAAMGRRIDRLKWMSEPAKLRAQAKLTAFTAKIGYPDRWRDYTGLLIKPDDLFGNAVRANQFAFDYNVGKLGKPIYRWEWGMTPMEINAYASFSKVEIVFPAAILQPPFFDPHADPAINYGGIGAVIGHELSHHFDDQGAKYDESGKLAQWWTEADVAAFRKLSQQLVRQYDDYEPFPGSHVKGALTLGENIGDLAGLAVALDAYHTSLGGKPAPVINGTTGDQRFFLGWAQVWRMKYREAIARQRLVTDPHSPAQYRAATVRNFDAWYAAFQAKPTDRLYLPPQDRIRIW